VTADRNRVAAAHTLLAQLGVSVADLQAAPDSTRRMPTVAEYLPRVMAAATPSSCRTYGTYRTRMATAWGDRPLDTVAATDVEALQRDCAKHARRRSNGRGGRHAGENLISAARAFCTRAVADGLIPTGASPAHQVRKPRRLPSPRRALTPHELADINATARTSGNDVILDALLLRLHTETACRRGGALALRLMDLDTDQGVVRLREKGETLR
jgi:integrase